MNKDDTNNRFLIPIDSIEFVSEEAKELYIKSLNVEDDKEDSNEQVIL